jgi:hypothetical protein
MKILVDISVHYYDRILTGIGRDSRLYSLLINGMFVHDSKIGAGKVVQILCEKSDAEMLRDATKNLCPEATVEIEESIALSRPVSIAELPIRVTSPGALEGRPLRSARARLKNLRGGLK